MSDTFRIKLRETHVLRPVGFRVTRSSAEGTTYSTDVAFREGGYSMLVRIDGEERFWNYGDEVLQQLRQIESLYGLVSVDLRVSREIERGRPRVVVLAVPRGE